MTSEDIGSHLHYDEQVAIESYVLRNYAHLLTGPERAILDGGLEHWWEQNVERMHEWGARARMRLATVPPWDPAPFDTRHAEQVKAIVTRLRADHGAAIKLRRCSRCNRIGRGPTDPLCPWCRATDGNLE